MTAPAEPEFLTPAEAMALSGLSLETLRRREAAGLLTPGRTPGGHRRYRRDQVEALRRLRAPKGSRL